MTFFQEPNIAAPGRGLDATERETECRTALKLSFEALVQAAQRAGWDVDETALALLRLAGAQVNECVNSSAALATLHSSRRAYATERHGRSVNE